MDGCGVKLSRGEDGGEEGERQESSCIPLRLKLLRHWEQPEGYVARRCAQMCVTVSPKHVGARKAVTSQHNPLPSPSASLSRDPATSLPSPQSKMLLLQQLGDK